MGSGLALYVFPLKCYFIPSGIIINHYEENMEEKDASLTFPGPKLYAIAEKVAHRLTSFKLTVSSAESLTGGLVSALLTSVPGSSAFFMSGFTTYSNKAKHEILSVPWEVITLFGAVSPECANYMAYNAMKLAQTDLSISTTGIAGPTGGSDRKPVGLVFTAVAGQYEVITEKHKFQGPRHAVVLASAYSAMKLLYSYLEKHYPIPD
jgi:PncC family amidohydrolase